jgi:rhamnogalacturonyl hydrolase YesR
MGLFLSAYSKLGNVLGPDDCNFAIDHCANWLMENSGQGYPGISWGYPFDWQSKVFVPKNTPSIVVTSTVGEGFFDAYRLTGKKDYLGIAERVGNFIIEGLNRTPATDKTFCFSYTPLDQMCIHNANLMGAAFLLKIGNEIGNDKWMDVALLAAQYSLDRQNTDGSLYYASQDTGNERKHRDIYHSGFEIRAIYQFWNLTQDLRFKESLDRYLQFYAAAYIRSDDGAPVRDEFATTQVFDIHGCAEAILCPASLLTDYPELKEQLLGAYQWSLAHMKNRDGSWAYAIDSKGNVDRTPYVRWGQAWMLRALAELSSKTHKLENE